ncbi:DMT family transporter [Agaribacter flavus]|uniref:DMT family transporter n=1 Tax=Agaribacter flavus TaxID=1902781 RepID=A0ABV7FQH9_9ALTE
MEKHYQLGIFAIVIASCFWGTTGTAATFANGVHPITIAAITMGVGGCLLALLSIGAIKLDHLLLRCHWQLIIIGSLSIVVYPLAFYSAMHLSGVAIGNVVSIGSAPLFTALLERIFDKQQLSRRWRISAGLGLSGVALLSFAKAEIVGEPMAAQSYWGIGLGLLAGLSYATYSWVGHRLIRCGISARAAMGSQFGLGGVLLLPILIFTYSTVIHSTQSLAVGLYMAIVPTVLAYKLFGYGLSKVKASTATLITLLEPVIATLLAVTIVNEIIGLQGWSGMGMILLSLLVIIWPASTVRSKQEI